ncbi:MAG: methyltransferase domain-containing protein [Actinomycetota bacterium]
MSKYLFDHALSRERERLGKIEEWLDPGTIQVLEQLVQPGFTCLEVGAGAGSITKWLSSKVGYSGSVLAIDLSLTFLQDFSLDNVEVRQFDITKDPLPPNHFDLIHARCVLMHIPTRDAVYAKLVEALKPGGVIFIEDMDFVSQVSVTPSSAWDNVTEAMTKLLQMAGADVYFGRRIPELANDNRLVDGWFEGRISGGSSDRTKNPGLQNFRFMLEQLREVIVLNGLATEEDVDEMIRLTADPSFVGIPPAVIAHYAYKPV